MYKLQPNHPITGETPTVVKRIEDSAWIPFDPANTDYQAYLKWLEEGGVPLLADEQGGQ